MQSPELARAADPGELFDVVEEIGRLEHEAPSVDEFYRRGLERIARHCGAGLGALRVEFPGRHLDARHAPDALHAEAWMQQLQTSLLHAQVEGQALGEVVRVPSTGQEVALLAVPIHAPGSSGRGALGLVLAGGPRAMVEANLAELRALAGLLDLACPQPRGTATATSVDAATEGVGAASKAARFKDARELAFALTNGLRAKLDCEQIALGSVRGASVQVLSISGLDEPKLRDLGTLDLRQAMEECLDADATIVSQDAGTWSDDEPSSRFALHQQWRAAAGRACVASIPLRAGDGCVGILSLRRPHGQPFTRDEIEAVEKLVGSMGPALELLHRAGRGLGRHAEDALRALVREALAPARYGRKVLAAAGLSFAAWFFLGTTAHEAVVPCRLRPRETIQFSAPFEERIAESTVRPGDAVKAGDLLVRLSTDSLELERRQLEAELEVHQVEVDQGVAAGEWVQASLSKARMGLLETRLEAVVRRIEESSIRAAVDGIVLRGDLTHQIGQRVPQGEPLFEVAPRLDMHLELELPEDAVAEVAPGQTVRFASNARPDAALAFDLQQLAPAAEVREGRNVFVAEARGTAELPAWARPGMEGVGKVSLGRRPVWRAAFEKVVDSLYRMWL